MAARKKQPKKPKRTKEQERERLRKIGFQKGDPRINRNGAPKKIPLLKELMKQVLGVADGEDLSKSELAEVVRTMVQTAKTKRSGLHVAAGREILDRVFGKTSASDTPMEGSGDAKELKVQININRGGKK